MKTINKLLTVLALANFIFLLSCEFENEAEPDDKDNDELTTVNFSPFIELNTVGGSDSFVNAISNSGEVVGQASNENGVKVTYMATKDGMNAQGVLASGEESNFADVHELGDFYVGYARNSQGVKRPVMQQGAGTNLIELQMGDESNIQGEAEALGNGYIAGFGNLPGVNSGRTALLWESSEGTIYLGLDSLEVYDLDEFHEVVFSDFYNSTVILASSGSSTSSIANRAGYIWVDREWVELSTDIYPLIIPKDMNKNGQIAATVYDAQGNNYPAIYKDGTVTLLDLPAGFDSGGVNAINETGEVVGQAGSSTKVTPVYWDNTGKPTDLNTLLNISESEKDLLGYNPYIINAIDINDNGDIAGEGYFNLNDPEAASFAARQREGYILPGSAF